MRINQYLTFTLGTEVYGVDVKHIREVLPLGHVTLIPRTPAWIRGIINLRGNVVPVVDLRSKLGMGITETATNTSVIILELELLGEATLTGILADAVHEVVDYEVSKLEAPPRFGSRVSTSCLVGMGRRAEGVFLVLNIESIFGTDAATAGLNVDPRNATAAAIANASKQTDSLNEPGSSPKTT